jgi:hypothetical protein
VGSAACECTSPEPEDEAAGEACYRQSIDDKAVRAHLDPLKVQKAKTAAQKAATQMHAKDRYIHAAGEPTWMAATAKKELEPKNNGEDEETSSREKA